MCTCTRATVFPQHKPLSQALPTAQKTSLPATVQSLSRGAHCLGAPGKGSLRAGGATEPSQWGASRTEPGSLRGLQGRTTEASSRAFSPVIHLLPSLFVSSFILRWRETEGGKEGQGQLGLVAKVWAVCPPPGPAAPRGQPLSAPSVAQWHQRKGILMSLPSSRAPEAGSLFPAPRCQSNTPIPALPDSPSPLSTCQLRNGFLKWRIPARDRLPIDTLFRGWQARLKCPAVPTHAHGGLPLTLHAAHVATTPQPPH